jgi:DNA polymerase I-like protein with 3'-5' exonuclease and polymerase domains
MAYDPFDDPHLQVAARALGISLDEAVRRRHDKDVAAERSFAKTYINFGLAQGMAKGRCSSAMPDLQNLPRDRARRKKRSILQKPRPKQHRWWVRTREQAAKRTVTKILRGVASQLYDQGFLTTTQYLNLQRSSQ